MISPLWLNLALCAAVLAVVFGVQALKFPIAIQGLHSWAHAAGVLAAALIAWGATPLPVGAVLVLGSLGLLHDGLRRFHGLTERRYWFWTCAAIAGVTMAVVAWRYPTVQGQVMQLGLLAMLPPILYLLLLQVRLRPRLGALVSASALLMMAGLSFISGWEVWYPGVLMLLCGGLMLLAFERLGQALEYLVSHDGLTSTYSRRGFLQLAESELSRSHRLERPMALLVLDLDHLRLVNDRHGHPTGDMVLQKFAEITRACLRRQDVLGRFGGEEFMVVLPDTSPDASRVVAERIRAGIASSRFGVKEQHIRVTVSVGVVNTLGRDSLAELLRLADNAVYLAKTRGRNRVEVV